MVFGGQNDFVPNCTQTLSELFTVSLKGKLANHNLFLKLTAMSAMVIAWRDKLEGQSQLCQGNKSKLAFCLAKVLKCNNLDEN